MSTVTVRLFAALRDAAGTAKLQVEADDVAGLLDHLRARFGDPFSTRLAVATVLVGEDPVPHGSDRALEEGDEIVLLPPFSGGCGCGR